LLQFCKGETGIGVGICTIEHRELENSPAYDAKDSDQIHQPFASSKLCLLGSTPRFHDLVEGLYLPSMRVPV
jgi:hypothetical protein